MARVHEGGPSISHPHFMRFNLVWHCLKTASRCSLKLAQLLLSPEDIFPCVESLVQDVWTGGKRAVAGHQHRQTRQRVGCGLAERQMWFAGLADFSRSLLYRGTIINRLLVLKSEEHTPKSLTFSCSTRVGELSLTVRHIIFLETLCFKGGCSTSQSGCLLSYRPQSGGLHWLWSRERAVLLQPC